MTKTTGVPKLSPTADSKLRWIIWIVTGVVLILVGMMRRPEFRVSLPQGFSLDFLPAVYSIINALVAVFLVLALLTIKQRKIAFHQHFITIAVILSGLFRSFKKDTLELYRRSAC